MPIPISALIITYNEEVNVRYTLVSLLPWVAEIFVVDSFSKDATVEICREYATCGVQVWQHPFENYAAQRSWALQNLPFSNEWVLVLDADERITPELGDEVAKIASSDDRKYDGYYVRFHLIFMGKWIKHVSQYPVWLMRFYRRAKAHYDRSVNEHAHIDGRCGFLRSYFIHEDNKGIYEWIGKHNRYSSLEAEEYLKIKKREVKVEFRFGDLLHPVKRRAMFKRLYVRLPLRPLVRFLYMYVVRLGFLDGKPGLIYALLRACHEFHISVKIDELKLKGKCPPTRRVI